MRIGIDVDNTITDTLPIMKEYCKKYNDDVVKRNLTINENGFAASNLYDWTEEEKQYFFDNILEEVILKVEPKENAQKVIRQLKQENHKIYIITARTKAKNSYELTLRTLQKYHIPYDELVIQKDKKQYCIDNNIDVLIDDEPQNIIEVSKIIPVIVFEWLHNKSCEGKNIIKVKSWDEAYNVIKEVEKKGDK